MDAWREALVVFIFLSIGLWAWKAKGQERVPCVDREVAQQNLAKVGERPTFIGLSNRGHLTTLFVNKTTGLWTATYITADGMLCIVDVGAFAQISHTDKEATYERR